MTAGTLRRADLELSANFAGPENSAQTVLSEIYRQAFSMDQIGIDDDYFELGGDSLTAAIICTNIAAQLKKKIQPGILSRNRTIRKLTLKLNLAASETHILQNIQPGRAGAIPIFILPGNSGFSILRPAFLDVIGTDTPLYAFQIPGLSSPEVFPAKIQDLAQAFVNAITALKNVKDFHLVSFCGTGVVHLHMLEQLKKIGREPVTTVLVDPSFSLALPLLREKLRSAGKSPKLSPSAYWRMKFHVMRKLGRWNVNPDSAGNFAGQNKPGREVGGARQQAQVKQLWGANYESAMAANLGYALMLKNACPPPYEGKAHMITSLGYWQGRSRTDVDAARIFVPNAKWQKLNVDSHDDLIVKDQSHLAKCLREILDTP